MGVDISESSDMAHVDPELRTAVGGRPALKLTAEKLPKSRDFIVQAAKSSRQSIAPDVEIDEIWVKSAFGSHEIRVLRYAPKNLNSRSPSPGKPTGTILHAHAGGFVMGMPEMAQIDNSRVVASTQCILFSVDYRLAPEHPYPAALQDVYSVLLWLDSQAETLGVDRNRLGIKGESGGGGIAAAVALYARDQKGPRLAFQHLIYPMLDDRTVIREDLSPLAGQIMWTNEHNQFGWASLLGAAPGAADVSPYAAAARASELAGLPPTFISVGDLDLFCEENIEYARRLSKAGVPVELHVYPGAYHGFRSVMAARIAQRAEQDSHQALERSLNR